MIERGVLVLLDSQYWVVDFVNSQDKLHEHVMDLARFRSKLLNYLRRPAMALPLTDHEYYLAIF